MSYQQPEDHAPYAPYQQQAYTQPPQQYAPYQPPRAPKKRHTVRNILAGVFAVVVGIIVLSVALSGTKSSNSTVAAGATTKAVASRAAAPAPKPVVVLTQSGTGMLTVKPFTVAATWSLTYTFNCTNFGQSGNFIVYEDYPNGDSLTNALALKGAETTYRTDDAGEHTLLVSTECDWTIKVTSNG